MKFIVNNIKTQIGIEDSSEYAVAKEIKSFLSFKVKGCEYSDAYKRRKWDGFKSFVSADYKFLTGFLPKVFRFLREGKYEFDVQDIRNNTPKFLGIDDLETVDGFEYRNYQEDAIYKCNNVLKYSSGSLYFPRGIINAATNAGKTLIASGLFKNLDDCKCLFIVHNDNLFNQLIGDFGKMLKCNIGSISKHGVNIQPFTMAMVKTLDNRIKDDPNVEQACISYFNTVIIDEAHRAGSETYYSVMNQVHAAARYGMSGTSLDNDDEEKNLSIIGLTGNILARVTNEDLISRGVSRKPVIRMHYVDEHNYPRDVKLDYPAEYEHKIIHSKERMKAIRNLVDKNETKSIMISYINIEHGDYLFRELSEAYPLLNIHLIHGTTSNNYKIIDDFKSGRCNILISSMVVKEGLNLPNIDLLIMAQGQKSKITVKQLIGRALRTKEGTQSVEIHDFIDEGKYVHEHSMDRMKTYTEEGFEIIEVK